MTSNGHYGPYGGQYVAETLMKPLADMEKAYQEARNDPGFKREFDEILHDYVGRESPITVCRRLTEHLGGATIVLTRVGGSQQVLVVEPLSAPPAGAGQDGPR